MQTRSKTQRRGSTVRGVGRGGGSCSAGSQCQRRGRLTTVNVTPEQPDLKQLCRPTDREKMIDYEAKRHVRHQGGPGQRFVVLGPLTRHADSLPDPVVPLLAEAPSAGLETSFVVDPTVCMPTSMIVLNRNSFGTRRPAAPPVQETPRGSHARQGPGNHFAHKGVSPGSQPWAPGASPSTTSTASGASRTGGTSMAAAPQPQSRPPRSAVAARTRRSPSGRRSLAPARV